MNRTQIVFLGPSLNVSDARTVHPDAIYLPPAAMGDVLGALRKYRPHAIGLVDGTFLATMSVFHKELLYAVDQGTWVLGASSMGALRAAETDCYGVVGVGNIYERLASGDIEDDDEVALTHADAEGSYRALSDAMVTIRAALNGAADLGIIDADVEQELLRRSKLRWFPDRRLTTVIADAIDIGVAAPTVDALRQYFRHDLRDPKRADALQLLEKLKELPDEPPEERPQTVMSPVFHAMLARDVVVDTDEGSTTFDRIRRYAAVNEPDYEEIMSAARQRLVLVGLGVWLMGDPAAEDLTRARARIADRLGVGEPDLEQRARELDLDESSLTSLVYSEAVISRWENSSLARLQHGLIAATFTNELRMRGRYEEMRGASALQMTAAGHVHLPDNIRASVVLRSHAALTGWRIPDDLLQYLEDQELGTVHELLNTLHTSIRAQQALFGVGLVEEGEHIAVIEDGEPMMTRGA